MHALLKGMKNLGKVGRRALGGLNAAELHTWLTARSGQQSGYEQRDKMGKAGQSRKMAQAASR
ncbi:hypothetical protein [Herbaspirillum camelliae]|uniref:hypothetical protein n=1 Tax=Herbaspirillum camelliae TaxID=1892903 RepID=UPI00117ACCCD|nr:hypothetical protein [Herbaspirillum camelliae]